MNSTHVGVLEQSNQVSLGSFLKSHNSGALESSLDFDFVGDFLNKSLERQFSDQKFSGSLVLSDFSNGDSSWFESVGLLDSAGGGGGLLGGSLLVVFLSGSLNSGGGFSGSSFGSGHLLL
jgi:hypothetical protein